MILNDILSFFFWFIFNFFVALVKPSITNASLFPRTSLIRGTNGRYECYAEGVPIPQVKWYRNSTLLASGNKMAAFTITEGKIEDTDTYRCEASNPGGVASKDMLLEIACMYSFIDFRRLFFIYFLSYILV